MSFLKFWESVDSIEVLTQDMGKFFRSFEFIVDVLDKNFNKKDSEMLHNLLTEEGGILDMSNTLRRMAISVTFSLGRTWLNRLKALIIKMLNMDWENENVKSAIKNVGSAQLKYINELLRGEKSGFDLISAYNSERIHIVDVILESRTCVRLQYRDMDENFNIKHTLQITNCLADLQYIKREEGYEVFLAKDVKNIIYVCYIKIDNLDNLNKLRRLAGVE